MFRIFNQTNILLGILLKKMNNAVYKGLSTKMSAVALLIIKKNLEQSKNSQRDNFFNRPWKSLVEYSSVI